MKNASTYSLRKAVSSLTAAMSFSARKRPPIPIRLVKKSILPNEPISKIQMPNEINANLKSGAIFDTQNEPNSGQDQTAIKPHPT